MIDVLCRPRWFAALLLTAATALSLAFADRGLPTNDEGALLTNAAKLLRGAVFYRDVDAYPFPGAAYLLALAMRLFGEHLDTARQLAVGIYAGAGLALYAAALRVCGARRAALFGLAYLALKFVAWPAFTTYMYSDVAFLFACAATALLVGHPFGGPSLRLAAAGVCAGLALAAKQNLGIPLVGAVALLLLFPRALFGATRGEPGRPLLELASFAGGVTAVLAPALLYFASQGLLGSLVESGLVRPFTDYAPHSAISFAAPLRWWELGALRGGVGASYLPGALVVMLMGGQLPREGAAPWLAGELFARSVYTSVPLVLALAGWGWLRARRVGPLALGERERAVLALLTLAALASAFPRADFFHVASVYPLVLLLLFAQRRGERVLPEALGAAALVGVTAALSLGFLSHMTYRLELQRADVRVSPYASYVESVVRFVQDEVREDEPLFVYGHEAYYYFLSGRFDPWPFAQLYPGQTGGGGGRALASELVREPPALIVRGAAGDPPLPSYTRRLFRYVSQHFEVDDRVFARYPPPRRVVPPEALLAVLRPRLAREPRGADPGATSSPLR